MKIRPVGAELFHADGRLVISKAVIPNFFFHLRTPWQPISINYTLHISKMFVINIVDVISNLYVDVCAFFRHYSIFFAYP
jgi:hypothetical protein